MKAKFYSVRLFITSVRTLVCAALTIARLACLTLPTPTYSIMAGGEFNLPVDRPSLRVDQTGAESNFNFVGALEINIGSERYIGTAVALSPHWVLTAGHNVDFNDDGVVDPGLGATLYLPDWGIWQPNEVLTYPEFRGFRQSDASHDLALMHFSEPLPDTLSYPRLGLSLAKDDLVTLVGFGRSGYGSYGYTSNASLTQRRIGYNIIDEVSGMASNGDITDAGAFFQYDFDDPASFGMVAGSLGNDQESIIGPGDSGGPLLREWGNEFALLGINTFTSGYGGIFGDEAGGIVLAPYWSWISETTDLAVISEPELTAVFLGLIAFALQIRLRRETKTG